MGDQRQAYLEYRGSFVELGGTRLFYRRAGEKPLNLVCLAGGPGGSWSGREWTWTQFGDTATTWLLDLRGTGYSDAIQDYRESSLAQDIADVEAFRKALGLGRIVLLGHSYGGNLALRYTMEHEAHVEKLIVVGPTPVSNDYQEIADKEFGGTASTLAKTLAAREEELLGRYSDIAGIVSAFFSAPAPEERNAALRELLGHRRYRAFVGEFMVNTETRNSLRRQRPFIEELGVHPLAKEFDLGVLLAHTLNGDLELAAYRDRLRSLSTDTLILAGHHMGDGIEVVNGRQQAELIPGARLASLPESGHFPMDDEPEAFVDLTKSFIVSQ